MQTLLQNLRKSVHKTFILSTLFTVASAGQAIFFLLIFTTEPGEDIPTNLLIFGGITITLWVVVTILLIRSSSQYMNNWDTLVDRMEAETKREDN